MFVLILNSKFIEFHVLLRSCSYLDMRVTKVTKEHVATDMPQKYFPAIFKEMLNFELFWRIRPQGKHAVKEVYNCLFYVQCYLNKLR